MKNQKDKKGKKGGKKSVIPSFLTKLYQILENSEFNQIVRWSDNGKAFVVKNLPEFIERVLPSYFKHNNFASFVRQLNMYDFHKTRNSNNENTFYHKLFIKGQKNLLKLIKRKINNAHLNYASNTEDTDLTEIIRDEKDLKNLSKKNLEEIYQSVLKNIDEVSKRQNDLEHRIDFLSNRNEQVYQHNKNISDDIVEKRNYTKHLEALIFFVFELMTQKRVYFLDNKETENKEGIKAIGPNETFKNMLDSLGENVLNSMADKYLNKLKPEELADTKDIGILKSKIHKLVNNDLNNNNNIIQKTTNNLLNKRKRSLTLSNLDEEIFKYKHDTREKKEEDKDNLDNLSDKSSGQIQLNMFDEKNNLSPCLVNSPIQTPRRIINQKVSDVDLFSNINNEGMNNNIKMENNNINNNNQHFENFFSLEDIENSLHNKDKEYSNMYIN